MFKSADTMKDFLTVVKPTMVGAAVFDATWGHPGIVPVLAPVDVLARAQRAAAAQGLTEPLWEE